MVAESIDGQSKEKAVWSYYCHALSLQCSISREPDKRETACLNWQQHKHALLQIRIHGRLAKGTDMAVSPLNCMYKIWRFQIKALPLSPTMSHWNRLVALRREFIDKQIKAECGIENGLLFVTPFFLNLSDCLYCKRFAIFIQFYKIYLYFATLNRKKWEKIELYP